MTMVTPVADGVNLKMTYGRSDRFSAHDAGKTSRGPSYTTSLIWHCSPRWRLDPDLQVRKQPRCRPVSVLALTPVSGEPANSCTSCYSSNSEDAEGQSVVVSCGLSSPYLRLLRACDELT